jgi:hypothetical protein
MSVDLVTIFMNMCTRTTTINGHGIFMDAEILNLHIIHGYNKYRLIKIDDKNLNRKPTLPYHAQ